MNSNYTGPIIQGTAVPAPGSIPSNNNNNNNYGNPKETYHASTAGETYYNDTGGYSASASAVPFGEQYSHHHQQQQPNQFRDVFWAIAFLIHLGVMIVLISTNLAGQNGNDNGGDDNGGGAGVDAYGGTIVFVALSVLVSMGLSTSTISLMMKFPAGMVKLGLIFSAFVSGVFALLLLSSGSGLGMILGIFFFAITVCYVCSVWNRIPYAAANLKTALTAVKCNGGLAVVAYLIMTVAFAWCAFWMMGVANSIANSTGSIVFLLFISFYWTYGVLTNTVHVTTAGTVGTWWFVPVEANGCFSGGLRNSFVRATTYSFGSICFGSLLVAVVQALRAMARNARNDEDSALLACLLECILACIQDIIEYFNKWAYVYVGLYGFGYIEAGRNVMQLFQNKGWTTVIADDLVGRVLMMLSMGVGVVSGLASMLLAKANPNLLSVFASMEDADGNALNVAYVGLFLGFLVGMVVCSILMSVVGSAADTVLVCFAESPAEFEANHPVLSRELRAAWREAWPELAM